MRERETKKKIGLSQSPVEPKRRKKWKCYNFEPKIKRKKKRMTENRLSPPDLVMIIMEDRKNGQDLDFV